jgi:hypothetical protein
MPTQCPNRSRRTAQSGADAIHTENDPDGAGDSHASPPKKSHESSSIHDGNGGDTSSNGSHGGGGGDTS